MRSYDKDDGMDSEEDKLVGLYDVFVPSVDMFYSSPSHKSHCSCCRSVSTPENKTILCTECNRYICTKF